MNVHLNSRVESGAFAIIDAEDYKLIEGYTWHLRITKNIKYAYSNSCKNKKVINIAMHRLVMRAGKGEVVDHRDGNGLNNQKANLRIVTHSQNFLNTRLRSDSRSGYKGVRKNKDKWIARISVTGKRIHLGSFDDKLDAARAYNEAALKYFGEYERLNDVTLY